MAAIAGSRRVAVRRVPVVQRCSSSSYVAPSLRGKISYQAPESASSRSTSRDSSAEGVTWSRSGRRGELVLDRRVGAGLQAHRGGAGGVAQAVHGIREHCLLRGGAGNLGACPLEHEGALVEHELGVDVGADLDRRVVLPRAVRVGPALDAVAPPARAVGADPGHPGVEAGVRAGHRHVVLGAVGVGEHDGGVDGVVAFAEHRRGDGELLVDDGLGGPGAAVDGRA